MSSSDEGVAPKLRYNAAPGGISAALSRRKSSRSDACTLLAASRASGRVLREGGGGGEEGAMLRGPGEGGPEWGGGTTSNPQLYISNAYTQFNLTPYSLHTLNLPFPAVRDASGFDLRPGAEPVEGVETEGHMERLREG